MSISIYNSSGIIDIIQNLNVPRSYFQCGGSARAIGDDYVQISIDKDTYNVLWGELDIDGYTPESQYAALYMLAQVFANVPVNPPAPPPPTVKVNPPSSSTFNIPSYPPILEGDSSDFTIEWLQYMHTDANFPRIYSIGQYPAQNAVSIEGGTLYLWLNGSIAGTYTLSLLPGDYLDTWLHVVITRSVDTIYVWINEILAIGVVYTSAIPTNGLDFYIGSENADGTYYNGLISNFRWTNSAVYGTSSPTFPIDSLTVLTNTILLIGTGSDLAAQLTDQSGTNTITASNVTYNVDSGISGYPGSLQFGTI